MRSQNKGMYKNKEGNLVYQRKPRVCRLCLSKSISVYIFGFPDDKLVGQIEKGYPIKLGGCCIDLGEYRREWHCNDCGYDFYKKYI